MASAALTPEEIQYQLEHAHETKKPMIIGICVLFVATDTTAVVLRLLARRMSKLKLQLDDHLIVFALFLAWGIATEIIIASVYGIGRHVVTLDRPSATKMSKASFSFQATFPILNVAVKLSVLFLYRRIFGTQTTFVYLWWASLVWTVAGFAGHTAVVWSQCTPISDFWELERGRPCRISFAASVAANIVNIIGDLIVMVLPIPMIWKLKLPTKKKLSVTGIFVLGSAALIISIIRTPMIKSGLNDNDSTYGQVDGILLTLAEPGIGIICACLPVMWPLLKRSTNIRTTQSRTVPRSRITVSNNAWESLGDSEASIHRHPNAVELKNGVRTST